jgi:dihydrofolate synthase / folylpolyglutamate synthase
MINTFEDLKTYLNNHPSIGYQRDHYDRFLNDYPQVFTIPFIHITGTNGKGSTARYLASVYQQAGYKVGLYTSPPLVSSLEMIAVNGQLIQADEAIEFFNQWSLLFDQYKLTSFEMLTLLMFHYFEKNTCDLAIIEVGMGGMIDATTVFTPIASVITSLSLEHKDFLGPTLKDIAQHKAGIIKSKAPVFIGQLPNEAKTVVLDRARQQESTVIDVEMGRVISYSPIKIKWKDKIFLLNTPALYQIKNASLALTIIHGLKDYYPVQDNALEQGLLKMTHPGRLEFIHHDPLIILDGAHNPEAIQALGDTLRQLALTDLDILFAAFKDKEVDHMLPDLSQYSNTLTVTTFAHPRARQKSDYTSLHFPFAPDYKKVIQHHLNTGKKNRVLLITGSLAFVGEVRAYIEQLRDKI